LITAIANDIVVGDLGLSCPLLLEVLGEQLLVLVSTVFSDFFSEYLLEVLEEFISESSCTVAFLARKSLLVDFLAIASEAFW